MLGSNERVKVTFSIQNWNGIKPKGANYKTLGGWRVLQAI